MVTHAGQGCALTSRLLVPRSHHDLIVDMIAQNFARVRFGDPSEPKTYMGPLISARQRDKVDAMVQRAIEAGATLVTGGEKIDPGFFYTPTLLTNVDPDSEIAQQEVFGPVLAVIAFDDDDDAVRIANNSIYGLAGAVFSGDGERALQVARRIRAGSFSINGGNYFNADSPFGGYKQSGIGREMGVAGLEEFQERKTFATVVG
jgi:acyl-CoA reductase-like NAD-dependent aldehyde dehydrogenase